MQVIKFQNKALDVMLDQATQGYKIKGKKERIGVLLGRKIPGGSYEVKKAVSYRGGERGRTWVDYYEPDLLRRVRILVKKHRLAWLGLYHTHVESAGSLYHALSEVDKESFLDSSNVIEVTVNVTFSDDPGRKVGRASKTLFVTDGEDNRYLIKGYVKSTRGIRQVKATAPNLTKWTMRNET